ATGSFGQTASIPAAAADLSPEINQLHSSEYQRPDQVAPGRVLVVGASHSGTDIAYELAQTHEVTLCGRDCGQIPFRPEERKARLMFPLVVFA
ncbi:SidA/IucD/PvdA family monooxygenase, partial [Klebsiella pneumoniae]|uniref:SidA/IucD/PvdA family monooxygenase n=1 Tax=Klebsiella pneumoniae TaxID=573 RepID=UPI00210B479F